MTKRVGSGPATSKSQFRFMEAVAHGMRPRDGGPSKAQAQEYVSGQSNYKSLPERKGKKK